MLSFVNSALMRALTPTEIAAMSQASRTRLIGEIVAVVRQTDLPPEARKAALTLVGWLARRMPGDEIDSRTLR